MNRIKLLGYLLAATLPACGASAPGVFDPESADGGDPFALQYVAVADAGAPLPEADGAVRAEAVAPVPVSVPRKWPFQPVK